MANFYEFTSRKLIKNIPSLDLMGVDEYCWSGTHLFLSCTWWLVVYDSQLMCKWASLKFSNGRKWSKMSCYPDGSLVSLLHVDKHGKPCGILTMFV